MMRKDTLHICTIKDIFGFEEKFHLTAGERWDNKRHKEACNENGSFVTPTQQLGFISDIVSPDILPHNIGYKCSHI